MLPLLKTRYGWSDRWEIESNNKCTDAHMRRGYLAIHDLHSKNCSFLMLFISLLYVNSLYFNGHSLKFPQVLATTVKSHHECLRERKDFYTRFYLSVIVSFFFLLSRIINRNNSQSDIIFHPLLTRSIFYYGLLVARGSQLFWCLLCFILRIRARCGTILLFFT